MLNRVLSQTPSQIFGTIRANGRVFIMNPRGVVFGKGARVEVGGLFAAGLDITNDDFMAGRYRFFSEDGKIPGSVVNRGFIQAASGGFVALVGGSVSNEGTIVADLGHVNLAAGRTAVLDFDGNGLIRFEVDDEILENVSAADDAVSNTGEIRANGGTVTLTSRVAQKVFNRAVNNEGIIRAARIEKKGGKITLAGFGGPVRNLGEVDASADASGDAPGEAGGEIRITSDTAIDQYGVITADASDGSGGTVVLESADTTMVGGDSITSARSESAKGGVVQLLGDKVGLVDDAVVDASGASGGGTVLVGGGYQGKDPSVPNATATYVGPDAAIHADAIEDGDGGTVIAWADVVTRAHGTFTARGGEDGGDGGLIETSGKVQLDLTGITLDASSPTGKGGLWFIDPFDVTITTSAQTEITETSGLFEPTATGANILHTNISTALTAGTSVTITTAATGAGAESGDVTQDAGADISKTGGGPATLTINAAGTITLNGNIDSTVDTLVVALNANDQDPSQADPQTTIGDLIINGNIDTNGGNFTASGGVAFTIASGSNIDTGGGSVTIDHTGTITIPDSGILAGTGIVDIETTAGSIVASETTNTAPNILSTAAISLTAATGITDSATTDGFDIDSNANSVTVSVTGTGNANIDYVSSEGDSFSFAGTHTGTGDITFDSLSTGTLTVNATSTTASDITILHDGSLSLAGAISAGGAGDVTLVASGGSIEDATSDATVDITAGGQVVLTAAGNIDGGGQTNDRLELASGTNVDASSTSVGDIQLSGLGALTLADVDTVDGGVDITSGGALVATDVESGDAGTDETHAVVLTATAGNLTVGTISAAAGATLVAAAGSIADATSDAVQDITVGVGPLLLTAAGNIDGGGQTNDRLELVSGTNVDASSTSAGDIQLAGLGALTLGDVDAVTGEIDITAAGALVAADVTIATDAAANDIVLQATGGASIEVGTITTGTGASGVVLDSSSGAVTDADGNSVVTSLELSIDAGTGIGNVGTSLPIKTVVSTLEARTVSGDIHVTNTGTLAIGDVTDSVISTFSGVSITGGSAGDDIEVFAASPLTVSFAVSNSGGGNIDLAADGSAATDDLTINAGITASGGNGDIDLVAGDSIDLNAITVSASGTGDVTLSAGTDNNAAGALANGTTTGSIDFSSNSVVESDEGDVLIRAPEGVLNINLIDADGDDDVHARQRHDGR